MANEIVQINADKIAKITGYSSEEIAIIKQMVAKGTTDTELAFFLTVCRSANLNPVNKEIWCYKNKQNALLIFTGRDGFLSKAQSNSAFNGIRSSEVCKNDEFSLDIANNLIKHSFGSGERGEIIGAYAIVFRKGGEPTIEYADIKTYDKKQFTWNDFKAAMIKKVAETNALKKAFGISGVQSEYDFDVKNEVAIPITEITGKPLLGTKTQELISLIDSLPEEEQELYRTMLTDKREAKELTLGIIEDMILQVRNLI